MVKAKTLPNGFGRHQLNNPRSPRLGCERHDPENQPFLIHYPPDQVVDPNRTDVYNAKVRDWKRE